MKSIWTRIDKWIWKWVSRIPTRCRISHHFKTRIWVNGKEVEPNSPAWKKADKAFDRMDKRFDKMHKRFDKMHKRFEKMHERFDRMDKTK